MRHGACGRGQGPAVAAALLRRGFVVLVPSFACGNLVLWGKI